MTDQSGTPLPKIGTPATRALAQAGYTSLESLNGASASQLLAMHGVGPKALRILEPILAKAGFRLAD